MIIKSSAGTEHVRAEYSITRDINGIPTLETEYFQPIHHHVDPIKVHIKDSDDVYIVVINESDTVVDSSRVKLTAVHSLIYDFTGSRIYDEITQHFSIEGILSIVFDDTDYDFEVAGDRQYYAMQFQNFGGARTRLELLGQICNRWECEYDVVGNMVYIKDKVGAKDTENKKFRYLMNINDSKVEFDITEGATYIKGYFGKQPDEDDEETENTYFELDYTHQLANQYGLRHAEPYSNENITTTETAEQYLKNRLENTWRLSIDIDVVELESSTNSEYFLGDVVWAIDERIDIDMQTRIIKIVKTYDIDDRLLSTNVTLGNKSFVDYVLGSTSGTSEFVTLEDLERESMTIEEEIARKIAEFESAFNAARDQMRAEYTQAYADAQAEIEALDEKMATEIATEIASFEDAFNSEVQAAKDLAAQQIATTEQRINTEINTARNEIESDFNLAVSNARDYAEQQAEQQADTVRGELNTFAGIHSQLVQDLEANVSSIDDFLGNAREITLDQRLIDMTQVFDERINNIREGNYNMIRGSSLDESSIIHLNGMDLMTDERINYVSGWLNAGFPYVRFLENITLEAGKQYTLSFDYRTDAVPEMDVVRIRDVGGTWYHIKDIENYDEANIYELVMDNTWHRAYIRFTPNEDITGQLDIGTDYVAGDTTRGLLHIRLPYLTTTGRTQWLFHPLDTTQNVEEVSQRLTLLEDGYSQMIVRSEWDSELNTINQTIRDYQTTVDGVEDTIIQLQDSEVIVRGREVIDTVEGFNRKVWLGDVSNIRPNLIPYSDVTDSDFRTYWNQWHNFNADVVDSDGFYVARSTNSSSTLGVGSQRFLRLVNGVEYVLSVTVKRHPQVNNNYNYTMILRPSSVGNQFLGNPDRITDNGNNTYTHEYVFTSTYTGSVGIRIGSYTNTGYDLNIRFKEPKLERGNFATPYMSAMSAIEQTAYEINMLVQDIDGSGLVRQSDITVSPSSVRIGSTQILNDNVLSSVLNVSPNAIDMITQKMRLSGDLYVDGDITSLAISAVEGNFSSLIVANLETNKLRARHINTNAIGADHLYVTNAMINKLIANSILTDEMTARSVNAINANFGSLFASAISTVDLNADNITSGTLSSTRLQVNNALINRLISNSILTTEMRSQSISAVRGDIADLRTRILTTDVIKSTHLSSSNAMIDKMFANNALISRLTSKSAFISNIRAIDLAADQVRVGFNGISSNVTINSSGVTISNGALTVNRTDNGAPTIIAGHNPNGVSLYPSTPNRRDSVHNIEGQYATRSTGTGSWAIYDFYMFEHFYTDLMLDFAIINMSSSPINVQVRINGTDGSTFSWSVTYSNIPAGTAIFPRTIRNIGIPRGTQERFFVETRTLTNHGKFGIHTYMVKHLDNGHGYPRLEHNGRV